jgi:hypothetical protein
MLRHSGMLFERTDAIDREVVVAGRQCERLTQAVMGVDPFRKNCRWEDGTPYPPFTRETGRKNLWSTMNNPDREKTARS